MVTSVGAVLVVPQGFEIQRVATNLNPTAMRTAPDGRIFLCEKHGVLRVIEDDKLLEEPVLTVTTLSTWNERGLVGVEFDPEFESNGFIYIQYTWTDGIDTKARVSRFTLNGNVAVEQSETIIFEGDSYSSNAGMHNGGSLIIDNDDKMFILIGDTTNRTLSQDLRSTYGKVLRINLDGTIPEDNPYFNNDNNETGIHPAIWASGLRNPFMAAYNPETDQTIIGDVGEAVWEELNLNQKGANFGWPISEGFANLNNNLTAPQIAYHHNLGCAITGLAFYQELENEEAEYLFPEQYRNKLFFGDYCQGWIRVIDINGNLTFKTLMLSNSETYAPAIVNGTVGGLSMTQGHDGSLYFSERGTFMGAYTTNMGVLTGSVYKLIYTGSSAPKIYAPLEQWPALPIGGNYLVSIGATGAAPLTYQWYRNDVLVSNVLPSDSMYTGLTTSAMNGTRFRVQVSNPHGTVMSNEVVLLLANNTGLSANIWVSQSTYSAGDFIEFNATIVDASQDPIRLVSWTVELMHQKHTHPVTSLSNVDGGNVTIPFVGEMDPVQGYIFNLIVQNSIMSYNRKKYIYPNLSQIQLNTDPPGMTLLLDQVETFPVNLLNISGVINMERVFYAPGAQYLDNETFVFVNWNDGDTNNEKRMTFQTTNSVKLLQANYCNVVDCPDIPLAPITVNIPIAPPTSNNTEPTSLTLEGTTTPEASSSSLQVTAISLLACCIALLSM
jgi:glucose/arabinose dehydrogenase